LNQYAHQIEKPVSSNTIKRIDDVRKGFIFMANSEYENLPNTDAINAQFQKNVTDIKSFEENN
jgi:hypothetical protein